MDQHKTQATLPNNRQNYAVNTQYCIKIKGTETDRSTVIIRNLE